MDEYNKAIIQIPVSIIWYFKQNLIYGKILRSKDRLTCEWNFDKENYDHYYLEPIDNTNKNKCRVYSRQEFAYWRIKEDEFFVYDRVGSIIDIVPDFNSSGEMRYLEYKGKRIGFTGNKITCKEINDELSFRMYGPSNVSKI